GEWSWDEVKKFFKGMTQKTNVEDFWYGIMSSDWTLPTHYGLTDEKKLREEIALEGGDDITWSIEMESLFFGENENSYFKFSEFDKHRKIPKAEYPHHNDLFMGKKKRPERRKKKDGEVTILAIDVATSPK